MCGPSGPTSRNPASCLPNLSSSIGMARSGPSLQARTRTVGAGSTPLRLWQPTMCVPLVRADQRRSSCIGMGTNGRSLHPLMAPGYGMRLLPSPATTSGLRGVASSITPAFSRTGTAQVGPQSLQAMGTVSCSRSAQPLPPTSGASDTRSSPSVTIRASLSNFPSWSTGMGLPGKLLQAHSPRMDTAAFKAWQRSQHNGSG